MQQCRLTNLKAITFRLQQVLKGRLPLTSYVPPSEPHACDLTECLFCMSVEHHEQTHGGDKRGLLPHLDIAPMTKFFQLPLACTAASIPGLFCELNNLPLNSTSPIRRTPTTSSSFYTT